MTSPLRSLLLILTLAWTGAALADDVVMAFGEKIPPYCFPESDSGIELDVIGEALAYRGHRLAPRYVPLARVPLAFRQGEVQAAMTDLGQDLSTQGAHYGEPAVLYQPVEIRRDDYAHCFWQQRSRSFTSRLGRQSMEIARFGVLQAHLPR